MKIVFVLLLLAFGLSTAGAHAFIEHAEPAVGSTVKSAPTEVCITFTMTLDVAGCRVQVSDAAGAEVNKRDLHADPQDARRLVVSLPTGLKAGIYKVVWRAKPAGEGEEHVTRGDFTFRITP